MMNTKLGVAALLATLAAGIAIGIALAPVNDDAPPASDSGREILYWKAPMNPDYRRDGPGKSPMGMDLVPVYAGEAAADDAGVRINPTVVNNLGVRTAAAERGRIAQRIDTVGYVSYDEDTVQHVHTRVEGWVEALTVTANGDPVTRGQVLFELYSPTIVNAQEEYLAAVRSGNTALVGASRERLEALGVTDEQVRRLDADRRVTRRIRVVAARDGVVAKLGVREGEFVSPETDILSIADLDSVWVLAEVLERQSAWIRAGLAADVALDYLPGQRLSGTIEYVYPELDPESRTLTVRLRFANPERRLRPNMFARVRIAGEPTAPVVHVPREALIRGGSVDRVVLALGGGHFRAQPVTTGIEAGDRVEIRRGVEAGQQIVTSGQFLIDSESNIDTALARLDEGDAGHAEHAAQDESSAAEPHAGQDMESGDEDRPAADHAGKHDESDEQ